MKATEKVRAAKQTVVDKTPQKARKPIKLTGELAKYASYLIAALEVYSLIMGGKSIELFEVVSNLVSF